MSQRIKIHFTPQIHMHLLSHDIFNCAFHFQNHEKLIWNKTFYTFICVLSMSHQSRHQMTLRNIVSTIGPISVSISLQKRLTIFFL